MALDDDWGYWCFGISGGVGIILVLVAALGAGLIIGLVVGSIDHVNYDEYGLEYSKFTRKVYFNKVYEPGRYVLGVGHRFLPFKRTYQSIEFSGPQNAYTGSGTLQSRTFDGLSISLEISFQYRIRKEDVIELFQLFGLEYEYVFRLLFNCVC
jgi:hypothetical protein